MPQGGFANWGPTDPPLGDQQEGNFYFNTAQGKWRWFHSGSWQDIPAAAGTAIVPFDFTDAPQSIPIGGGATVIRLVNSGKGTATIVVKGDGGADVNMYYFVDGGAQQLMGSANSEVLVPVAFNTSVTVTARNNGGIPENSSSVSTTGLYE